MLSLAKILRGLEYLSWVVTIAALSYAAYFFLSEMKDFNVNFMPTQSKSMINDKLTKDIPPVDIKSFDFYEKKINERDIFSNLTVSSGGSAVLPQAVAGQLPVNLKVVGIILGENPQVVIEDNISQQTYFIDKGSSQAGIQIDRIQGETLFLNYNGQVIGVDLKGSHINLQPTNSNL